MANYNKNYSSLEQALLDMLADGKLEVTMEGLTSGTVGAPSADVLTTQPPASTGSFATVANAAVDAAASTAIDAHATLGKRYARVIVNCDNAHTVRFYGHTADFSSIAAVYQLIEYAKTGVAAVSGYGGNAYLVDVSGLAFFCPVVTNDGADASTITVLVAFSD